MIGDAYHWIGHIQEDRRNLENAWEAYWKSHEHYSLSKIKHSVFISNLLTLDHAKFHLAELEKKTGQNYPWTIKTFAEVPVVTGVHPQDCLREYRRRIDLLQARIRSRNLKGGDLKCSSLF